MKNVIILFFAIALFSCTVDNAPSPFDTNSSSEGGKGLVQFKNPSPRYKSGKLSFSASIQFGSSSSTGVLIEYTVEDSASVVASGSMDASVDEGGLGIFYAPAAFTEVALDSATYTGKTLTVRLDPDNKVTSSEYQTEQYTSLYRVETVTIP